jgi:hypothetical protein
MYTSCAVKVKIRSRIFIPAKICKYYIFLAEAKAPAMFSVFGRWGFSYMQRTFPLFIIHLIVQLRNFQIST